MREYRARFPSAYASAARARHAIVDFARPWFDHQALSDIECAVGEALANAAEHGHADDAEFEVHCRYDGRQISIDIVDAGPGFSRWNASEYVRPMSDSPRGYGTFIMRNLMDTIEYGERGSRCRLVKRRRPS